MKESWNISNKFLYTGTFLKIWTLAFAAKFTIL